MHMDRSGLDPRAVREAAHWNVRLDSGEVTDEERHRLHAWLADPRNAREYDAQRQLLGWVQDLPPEVKQALARSLDPPAGACAQQVRRPAWACALVAGVIGGGLVAGLVLVLARAPLGFLPHSYSSGVGEIRTFGLPDGSTTSLNTRTRLKWVGSLHGRRVELLTGEVLFEVKHDPTRPFQIELKHSRITVLGTRFDVYQKANDDVVVTVVSGTVAVQGFARGGAWTERLTANQRLEYTPAGARTVRTVDASLAADWRRGILHTEGLRLPELVSELSRYTAQRIVICDPRLDKVTVGGAFRIRDVGSALQRLARSSLDVPITVTHSGDTFYLRWARAPTTGTGQAP